MKYIQLKLIALFLTIILFSIANGQNSLHGIITDSLSRQYMPSATVYLPQLKLTTETDSAGKYKLSDLPKGTYIVEVKLLGYATTDKQITINGATNVNFSLSASASNIQEVVITALGNVTNAQRSPIPVTLISNATLLQNTSTNAIDAIAAQPGISEVTEGPCMSKPEINGLGYNRVLTLFDGERQEDFQWGDEHGILIDQYSVYDAEIIRGPASLQYGANAEAGVISFKSESFAENGTIKGSVLSEYQTNNGMIGNSEDVGGNHNGFVWNIRASTEESHCYSDPKDGYVWGTACNQSYVRGMIGLNKKWGYSRLSVSSLHRQLELPDGNRDSLTGKFEFDTPQNGQVYPDRANYLSFNPDIAGYQVLDHDEVWWQNSIIIGNATIGADIGYTQSIRHEIDSGSVGVENMIVHDIPYSFKYQLADYNSGLKLTTGINGMYEFENNYPEPPAPYIGDFEIPDYHLFDAGVYGIIEKDYKYLTISGGLRYDMRSITGKPMYLANYNTPGQEQVPAGTDGAYQQFSSFSNTYTGFSGSIGASYQLPENNYVKLNVAKSFRAPAINELTSNELNGGSSAYDLGNINLKSEQGYEVDIAYGNNGKDVNFEVDGFYNYINHFIFADRLPAKNGGDSIRLGFPVFQYNANTAIMAGVVAYFNIHPADSKWIEVDNGFTYIYSYLPHQTDSTRHVPLTPAPRLTSEIKFKFNDRRNSILRGAYIQFGLEKDWAQNDIYSALYTELPSYAYTLYNAGIGTNFVSNKTKHLICSLYINCMNFMNIPYVDHLSHVQYFLAYNGGVPAVVTQQSQGIYNMGRNIGFKLIFPIGGLK